MKFTLILYTLPYIVSESQMKDHDIYIAQSVGHETENAGTPGTNPLPGNVSFLSFNLHDCWMRMLIIWSVYHIERISDITSQDI